MEQELYEKEQGGDINTEIIENNASGNCFTLFRSQEPVKSRKSYNKRKRKSTNALPHIIFLSEIKTVLRI